MCNQLGIFSWYGFIQPFVERVSLIKDAGFSATSLWWEDEQYPFRLKKEEMPALVRENGLLLENLHVPFNDSNALWSENTVERIKIINSHIKWLYDCAQHDIPIMVMHVNDGDDPPAPNPIGLKSLEKIIKEAEDLKVTVAIENTRRNDSISYALKSIQSDYLGFCFDSSHSRLTPKGVQLLKEYGHRLAATHISDNDGLEDRHWLPGQGIINWLDITAIFPETYKGCLSLEVLPDFKASIGSPQRFLRNAYQRLSHIRYLIKNNAGLETMPDVSAKTRL